LSSYRVVGLLGLQTSRGTVHVVVPTDKHVAVSRVGDGKQVRRHLTSTFALVLGDDVRSIDRQATVRVDDDAEQTRVRLRQTDEMNLHPVLSRGTFKNLSFAAPHLRLRSLTH